MRNILAAAAALVLVECAAPPPQYRSHVSQGLEQRIGRGLAPATATTGPTFPEGVTLDDGVSEDEAVATALWNNAAFQADLAELGFARADLLEAGLLRNPILTLLLPWGPKQLEFTASWPIEALWQRPRRVAAARLDVERVAENLVEHGLNLARDVRLAHTDLWLAERRAELAAEASRLRGQIAGLAQARLRAGDISELEATAAQAEARLGEEQAARAVREAGVASERFRALLGLVETETPLRPTAPVMEPVPAEAPELVKAALAARPELRAAELAMEAAAERARWERSKILSLAGVLDANAEGKEGFELGPGAQIELPFLQRNEGGKARAQAEVERAARRYVAVRHQILLEVREARAESLKAREALGHWRERILPTLEEAGRVSEKAYAAGDVSYLFVLETTRRLEEARLREAETAAELRRAGARLDYSVGRRRGGSS